MLSTSRLRNTQGNHSQCMPSMVGPGEIVLLLWGSRTPDGKPGYLWKAADRPLWGTDSELVGSALDNGGRDEDGGAIRPRQA